MATRVEDNVLIETTHRRSFHWRESPGAAFGFECDEAGNVDRESLNPAARENFDKCLDGTFDVIDDGVQASVYRIRLCACGSGEVPEDVYDARGIYVAKVCDKCREERLSCYREDIFTDPQYETDDQIDED